jgi:hypothetical protein
VFDLMESSHTYKRSIRRFSAKKDCLLAANRIDGKSTDGRHPLPCHRVRLLAFRIFVCSQDRCMPYKGPGLDIPLTEVPFVRSERATTGADRSFASAHL